MPVLDERLLSTPPVALELSHNTTVDMATAAVTALKKSLTAFNDYSTDLAEEIRQIEDKTDYYEDILGTYLVKLSTRPISSEESVEIAKLLKVIGDFERISDHSVNLLCSVEELREKDISFTPAAKAELNTIFSAVSEILDLS